MATRKVFFQGNQLNVPAEHSVEDIREALASLYPAIENAEAVENDDGSVTFEVRSGTKG